MGCQKIRKSWVDTVADPGFPNGGPRTRRRRRRGPRAAGARIEAPRSSAVGARIEAPKAPRGVGCGEVVSPSPLAEGSGEGAVPPPQKIF